MVKRSSWGLGKHKKSKHSHKTKKRLEIKRLMLAERDNKRKRR